MEYNLIELQKKVARELVRLFNDHNMPDEVGIAFEPKRAVIYQIGASHKKKYYISNISFGSLKTLSDEKMIDLGEDIVMNSHTITFRERLFTAVDTNFGEIIEVAPISPDKTVFGLDVKAYKEILAREFSKNEIKDICIDMRIEYEDLGSDDTLSGRIRELIKYCQRHSRLLELLITTAKARPRNSWQELWD
ncbi:hypothetical protein MNBD_CHLOROFLEXI01-3866 [hydrothermal vent metagenome]|uniref:Effector-associated domain-containing protein n=1 Tax=hydrothermal vent metagenome TaxID=652676 RepID=A0A3B0VXL0_9ZZZZ